MIKLHLCATFTLLGAAIAHAQITYWDPASGGNGHYYQPIAPGGGITWDNAKLAAESQGGYLATLTSAAENSFVFSLIDSPSFWQRVDYADLNFSNNNGPFIGGFQPSGSTEPDGGFQWLNGGGLLAATYSNWASDQPNNLLGGQHVTWFWSSVTLGQTPPRVNQWDDIDQSFTTGVSYVVEYDTTPVPEPAVCPVIVGTSLLIGAAFLRHRRYGQGTHLVEETKVHLPKGSAAC